MRKLDFYEFTGILIPGCLTLYAALVIFHQYRELFLLDSFSLSEVSLFLILSYAAGHLVQAIGNVFERIWWFLFHGKPTKWIVMQKGKILASEQYSLLLNLINQHFGTSYENLSEINLNDWSRYTFHIGILTTNKKLDHRLNIFSGNYGMYRGIIASGLMAMLFLLISSNYTIYIYIFILAILLLAVYRMHRFAKYYAQELFNQFICMNINRNHDYNGDR